MGRSRIIINIIIISSISIRFVSLSFSSFFYRIRILIPSFPAIRSENIEKRGRKRGRKKERKYYLFLSSLLLISLIFFYYFYFLYLIRNNFCVVLGSEASPWTRRHPLPKSSMPGTRRYRSIALTLLLLFPILWFFRSKMKSFSNSEIRGGSAVEICRDN